MILAAILSTLAALADIVTPQWTNHNRIAGSQQMMTNFKPWAVGVGNAVANACTKSEAADAKADAAQAHSEATRQIVVTWEDFLDGSNVVFSITNYLSGTYSLDHAKLRIMELRDGQYREVYNSRAEINMHVTNATRQIVGYVNAATNDLTRAIEAKGDRAWGNRSSTGNPVPVSNTVWVTEQNLRIAGGMEYERVAVGIGAIYVLTSKGMSGYVQGDEGALMLHDDGSTNYFGMVRSDSYVIGCNTSSINVDSATSTVELGYAVTMSDFPCIWYCPSLDAQPLQWEQLNLPTGDPVPGASHLVTWDDGETLGAKVCYINCPEPKGFFRATIEVAGEAKFETNMPSDLKGGIMTENAATGQMGVVKPVYNGTSVLWVWEAR